MYFSSTLIKDIKQTILFLWLSLSSADFYKDVVNNFKGWGMKYIIHLAFVAAFATSVILLYHIDTIDNYLHNKGNNSEYAKYDSILQDFPDIPYNGRQINLSTNNQPIFINGHFNSTIIAINQQVTNKADAHQSALITFGKEAIFLRNDFLFGQNVLAITYQDAFGTGPTIINGDIIKLRLMEIFDDKLKKTTNRIAIFIIFPMMWLLLILSSIFSNLLFILIIYFTCLVRKIDNSFQLAVRVNLYSTGIFIIIHPLYFLSAPLIGTAATVLQLWVAFLMSMGIFKALTQRY